MTQIKGQQRWWLCARHGQIIYLPNVTCNSRARGLPDKAGFGDCHFPKDAFSIRSHWCCRWCFQHKTNGRWFHLNEPNDTKCKSCERLRHDDSGRNNNSMEHLICRVRGCCQISTVNAEKCVSRQCKEILPNHHTHEGHPPSLNRYTPKFISKREMDITWLCTKCNRLTGTKTGICNHLKGGMCTGKRGVEGVLVVPSK